MQFWRKLEAEDVLEQYPDVTSNPEKYKYGLISFIAESAYYEIFNMKLKLDDLYTYLILMDAYYVDQERLSNMVFRSLNLCL